MSKLLVDRIQRARALNAAALKPFVTKFVAEKLRYWKEGDESVVYVS